MARGKKLFSCSCFLSPWQQFLNQHNFPCIDFPSYFETASTFCTFWDEVFHCCPCSHRLSSQLLMAASSSSSLHPQQPHRVHSPSTGMSGQISGVSRLPNSGRAKQPLPFLHLITLFSPRKSFHTDLCPSYSLLAQFTQELFMAHSPESPQTHTWKCNSTKLLSKSLYPPSCWPLTHLCRAPTKTQWNSRWDPTAFWVDWAYSIHLHTLGRVHLSLGDSAAFQRGQDKHSSALKSSCKAPRWWAM